MIIPLSVCGTNSQNMHYFAKPQDYRGLDFLPSDAWRHAHLASPFKKIQACSKVFVERIICFGELEVATFSSSF